MHMDTEIYTSKCIKAYLLKITQSILLHRVASCLCAYKQSNAPLNCNLRDFVWFFFRLPNYQGFVKCDRVVLYMQGGFWNSVTHLAFLHILAYWIIFNNKYNTKEISKIIMGCSMWFRLSITVGDHMNQVSHQHRFNSSSLFPGLSICSLCHDEHELDFCVHCFRHILAADTGHHVAVVSLPM